MRAAKRLCWLALIAVVLWLSAPRPAEAHPLGNFTVNRYSRIEVYADHLRVRYVLDMAEISAFQEILQMDLNRDGVIGEVESEQYRIEAFEALRHGLRLEINGARAALRPVSSELSFPIGQGNLKTLRLSGWFEASHDGQMGQTTQIHFRDDNFAERIGWREIVARAGDGVQLLSSSVPSLDESDELRAYPEPLLNNPLNRREANVMFQIVAASSAPRIATAPASSGVARKDDVLAQLIGAKELSLEVVLFSALAALVWGALHAFSPGHGKSVVAAYLVGSRGTARHALYLGLTITATHTLGVYALGLLTLLATQYILPERLYLVLSLISGALVVMIGVALFVQRLRDAKADTHHHGHDHAHGAHEHHHYSHAHGAHYHSSAQPLRLRTLLALGISGGLIPCPSALVVMLSAIALHRVEFGFVLIVAFSLGLALVLTLTGLLLVYAGHIFEWLPINNRFMRLIPVGSALVMTLLGVVIIAQSFG